MSVNGLYSYEEALNKSKEFRDIGSGSIDKKTRDTLEAMVRIGGNYGNLAQAELNFWNNPTSVVANYNSVPLSATNTINYTYGGTSEGQKDEDDIKKAYDLKISAIDSNLKRNEEMIAKQREAAIRQAYGQYDTEKATYGRNAEQLHAMGLGNSGYSDYLSGVAYSQMVGGLQNANETADEAVRQAYYNAAQQKAEATAQMEAAKSDEKRAYQDKLASLYAAAGSGEMDATTIRNIAKAYGIPESEVNDLVNTAYTTETNTAKTEFDNYISNKGNTDEYGDKTFYSADEIRAKAKSAGYSDEEIEKYVQDNDKMALDYYSSLIAAGNTDEDIDSLNVSDAVKTALKTKRDEKQVETRIETARQEIKANPTTKIIDIADELISAGKVDEGNELYFENDLALIESIAKGEVSSEEVKDVLDEHKRYGRLSEADYNNLISYLEAKTSHGVVEADKIKGRYKDDLLWKTGFANPFAPITTVITILSDKDAIVKIDGEQYRVNIDDKAEITDEEQARLDAKAGTTGNIVRDGENYYIKKRGTWRKVKKNRTDKDFYTKLDELVAQNQNAAVARPTHTKTTP